jgi:hypothetical protein
MYLTDNALKYLQTVNTKNFIAIAGKLRMLTKLENIIYLKLLTSGFDSILRSFFLNGLAPKVAYQQGIKYDLGHILKSFKKEEISVYQKNFYMIFNNLYEVTRKILIPTIIIY